MLNFLTFRQQIIDKTLYEAFSRLSKYTSLRYVNTRRLYMDYLEFLNKKSNFLIQILIKM